MRRWVIYLCHACGWVQGAEEDDLRCARCGEGRGEIEEVEVVEVKERPGNSSAPWDRRNNHWYEEAGGAAK